MAWILIFSVIAIAFANGANDNFKGVATLYGSGTADYRRALGWATLTTAAGSLVAVALAGSLLARFTGKGLVPDALTSDPVFLASVAGGAAITVLLASFLGAPVSTTHALLGALVGAGFVASSGALRMTGLTTTFLAPLLISPLLAVGLVTLVYPLTRLVGRRAGNNSGLCVCTTEVQAIAPAAASGLISASSVPITIVSSTRECAVHGLTPTLTLPRTVDVAHYISAGAVGFARGVNDTPKLVALLLPLQVLGLRWELPIVAGTIALGGIFGARRVAQTMSHRITAMTPDQGLAANLVTSSLVLVASRFGLPVSTTHVSTGSLFGLGAVTRGARWSVIGRIVFAWIATIPIAAACSALLWLGLARH